MGRQCVIFKKYIKLLHGFECIFIAKNLTLIAKNLNMIFLKFKCKLYIICTRQGPLEKITTLHCAAAYAAPSTTLLDYFSNCG